MSEKNVDIQKLQRTREALDQKKEESKTLKSEYDRLENLAINALVNRNRRFVDVSNQGKGPFLSLAKKKNDGSWNTERYDEFFRHLLTSLQKGEINDPHQLTLAAQKFLKQFEKRGLTLTELKKPPAQHTIEDLQEWLTGQSDE